MTMKIPSLVAILLAAGFLCAQKSAPQASASPASDPQALTLAAQSTLALKGRLPISDVKIQANVLSVTEAESGNQTGTATLQAKGTAESRLDISADGSTRTELRALTGTSPSGQWVESGPDAASTSPQPYAQHNCWTDPAWFFPVLSSLSQTSNPTFVFTYIGQEAHGGVNTQHIRVYQVRPQDKVSSPLVQRLSTTDFYLDPGSFLPLAIVFKVHPDTDMNTDIPVEVRFGDYRAVNGVQVPFRIQRMLNGTLTLDLVVTTAAINSGLLDTSFSVQ